MRRLQFLLSAASLLAAPALLAQTSRVRRVAIAHATAQGEPNAGIIAFVKLMGELGWTEGRNIAYVHGYANGDGSRYEPVVTELLAQKPDVLYAYFQPMALFAKKQTKDVPIVFSISPDPEAAGLIASLARPGGNVTGLSTRAGELDGKRFELLCEIKPGVQRVAVVVNPAVPGVSKRFIDAYGKIAPKLGVRLQTVEIRSEEEIGPAFDGMAREGVQAMLGTADPTHLFRLRAALVSHAARVGIPGMYVDDRYVEDGGLVSYGTDNVDQLRRAAIYVDKILRGAKPADLPVEEPTEFRMALNRKTAKGFKIAIPQSVLLRANLVID